MGRKSKVLKLDTDERSALENGYRHSIDKTFSLRCHIILLKTTNRTSLEIGEIFGITDQTVNNWVKRYESGGITGLKTRAGRGRPRILNKETDAAKVKASVKKERQRLKVAKEELESELDKKFSISTLTRFLKQLAAPTDELD